jgi:hypothetical protein
MNSTRVENPFPGALRIKYFFRKTDEHLSFTRVDHSLEGRPFERRPNVHHRFRSCPKTLRARGMRRRDLVIVGQLSGLKPAENVSDSDHSERSKLSGTKRPEA